ncbi:hypothetical protein JR316_0006056 [Psilocybe cubensis]|uniref:Uncharacterized protein n=1 Tax=Psilocybe cubensis TaxID=181762 RepID=A0ACB8H1E9_PSICU|nr:hypothetical protein JR316_0006056 [Psilocybe cubensis]KAH9481529.1 hypothetical protein JR316_0006056 [Psilocybe cubensis]
MPPKATPRRAPSPFCTVANLVAAQQQPSQAPSPAPTTSAPSVRDCYATGPIPDMPWGRSTHSDRSQSGSAASSCTRTPGVATREQTPFPAGQSAPPQSNNKEDTTPVPLALSYNMGKEDSDAWRVRDALDTINRWMGQRGSGKTLSSEIKREISSSLVEMTRTAYTGLFGHHSDADTVPALDRVAALFTGLDDTIRAAQTAQAPLGAIPATSPGRPPLIPLHSKPRRTFASVARQAAISVLQQPTATCSPPARPRKSAPAFTAHGPSRR